MSLNPNQCSCPVPSPGHGLGFEEQSTPSPNRTPEVELPGLPWRGGEGAAWPQVWCLPFSKPEGWKRAREPALSSLATRSKGV